MMLRTFRFSGVQTAWAESAQLVFAVRDGLKVCRVHAEGNAAQVVDLQPIGDRANHQLVGHPVSLVVSPGANSELSVAVPILPGQPNPTWAKVGAEIRRRPVLINLGPEPLGKGTLTSHLEFILRGVMRATVRAVRPLLIVPRPLSADGNLAIGAGMVAI